MRYHSFIGMTTAALLLLVPSQALAQTMLVQNVKFDLKEHSYSAVEQDLRVGSEQTPPSTNEKNLRVVPERGTRSAAYLWEASFLTLSAIDAAETISCLNRNRCTEGNPIWGHHPSTGKIVAAKLGLGLVHFAVFKAIANQDPKTALRAAQISAAVQGGFVLLNMNKAF